MAVIWISSRHDCAPSVSASYLSVDGEEGGSPDGGEVVVGHAVALALAGDGAQVADQARQGAAVDPGELGEEDAVPEIRIRIGL